VVSAGEPSAKPTTGRDRRDGDAALAQAAQPDRKDAVSGVGARLRSRREASGISLRQFARNLSVSPSFVSQIENGKSQPSVSTLYLICNALGLSIDELFSEVADAAEVPREPKLMTVAGTGAELEEPGLAEPAEAGGGSAPVAPAGPAVTSVAPPLAAAPRRGDVAELPAVRSGRRSPVISPDERTRLVLDSGVTWEQLSTMRDGAIDFMFVRYDVGGSSVSDGRATRHSGVEYGYIIRGTLEVTLAFDVYLVGPGQSISFDSTIPHRLTNRGDEPVEAIWFVHGRNADHEH